MRPHVSTYSPDGARLTGEGPRRMPAEPGTLDAATVDLDHVAWILNRRGLYAYVGQTGGGCATLFAAATEADYRRCGHGYEAGSPLLTACAGPGWFDGPAWTMARADAADLWIGPDDCGEADPTCLCTADPETIADALAAVVRMLAAIDRERNET